MKVSSENTIYWTFSINGLYSSITKKLRTTQNIIQTIENICSKYTFVIDTVHYRETFS